LVSNTFEQDNIRVDGNFWDAERMKREEPQQWNLLNEMHELPPEMLLRWWAEEDALRPDFERADLALIDVPTLVMAGDRDPIVPLQQTMDLYTSLPDAHLCILPGVGHGIPRRRPKAFNQIVLDFLKDVGRRFEQH
jgi:pimeloyl-ACP methyl ester carboxylesterase